MTNYTNILGCTAAILTTIAFIPQVIIIIKTKHTKDISLVMYIIFCLGVFLWLIYGIMLQAIPLMLANSITLALAMIILIFKIKYK